jgi:hypothetical protein
MRCPDGLLVFAVEKSECPPEDALPPRLVFSLVCSSARLTFLDFPLGASDFPGLSPQLSITFHDFHALFSTL